MIAPARPARRSPSARVAPDAGIAMIWVILCCALALFGALFGLYQWTDLEDARAQVKVLADQKRQLDTEYMEQREQLNRVLPYLALPRTGEGDDPPTGLAVALYKREYEEYHIPYLDLKKKVNPQLTLDNLQDCLGVAELNLDLAKRDEVRAQLELELRKGGLTVLPEREKKAQDSKQENVAKLEAEVAKLVEERKKAEADFTAKQQQEEELRKKAADEREAMAAKHKTEMIRLVNEISELKRRLEEVKRREVIRYDISEVHGEIIETDVESKLAFINLGSDQRVVKGLHFHVAVPGDYGRLSYKGEVEVKRVWPTRSQVVILATHDPEHPLVKGDQLVNPLFDTRRPKVVAFAGEPASRQFKYSINEATRRILEINSVVKENATVDLDFLIVTEAYEGNPNYLKAVELQIPVASATDIFKFLGD